MKHLYCIIIIFSHISSASTDKADKIGIFFTTPDIRKQLNFLRDQGRYNSIDASKLSKMISPPVSVYMQGVVIQKGHKPIVFLNNSSTLKSNKFSNSIFVNSKYFNSDNYSTSLYVNKNHIHIKPGQRWDTSHKVIHDAYTSFKIKSN
jgi:hypothetical protein